jgi:hypothetical protein
MTPQKPKERKFELLQDMCYINDLACNNKIELPVKGWNHNVNCFDKFILHELDEYYADMKYSFKLLNKKERGYCCSRYFEGEDASDEGHKFWIDYREYKKGLGKVTIYEVEIIMK